MKMQYPIIIAVALGAVGFQKKNMVKGTKTVISEMIPKILSFIMGSPLFNFKFNKTSKIVSAYFYKVACRW